MRVIVEGFTDAAGKLQLKFGKIQNVTFLTVASQLADAAIAVHADAVLAIRETHGSKTETRYNPKRTVTVSDPGSAPNNDTGTLMDSIRFEVDPDSLSAIVGTQLKYGAYLELGTMKMAARPWLFPALEKNRDDIREKIANAIREAVEGAVG